MLRVYACLTTEHDAALVAVAAAICLLATITAVMLAGQMRRLDRANRLGWLAALACVTGTGIWATHFIAMLAYRPHMPTGYAPAPTALSILIAVLVTGLAWSQTLRGVGRAWWPALLFTLGIAAMHFTGMAALQISGHLVYDPGMVAVAAALGWAIVTPAVAAFRRAPARLPLAQALLLSLAICTLHFGAMSAAGIRYDPGIVIPQSAVETDTLALAVGSLVVMLMGVALATALMEGRVARGQADDAERLKRFTEGAMEGLAILNGGCVIEANSIFWQMIGADPAAPPPLPRLAALLPGVAASGTERDTPRFRETELHRLDGTTIGVDVAIRADSYRGERRAMAVVRDISERKEAAARIAHLAAHDPLTGAANRLVFTDALESLAALGPAAPSTAMLCLDLDRFKAVNDLYGHPAGDAVLVEVTRRIRACLVPGALLARLGGDEFVILQGADVQPPRALAERLVAELGRPFEIAGHRLDVGVSVGVALCPADAATPDELHRKADVALYRAKADGRGTVRFFDAGMDAQLLLRHRMEVALRGAVAAGELFVHYQPLASLAEGEVVGFEALLRWRSPEFGDVTPARFIPLAEETGTIVEIGAWVLEQACAEAARWPRPLKIAVNLSPVQFSTGDLVATVEAVLAKTGLDPARLDLEITEGVLIKDADRALAVLTSLKRLGASIAMDDFGTGYSSLSYFRSFPFDKVKIDQSFVRDMAASPQAMAVVRAVIGLGKTLGMRVLAEGVETTGQMAMLEQEGCELIQGYAISRPAAIETFGTLLAAPVPASTGAEAKRAA